MAVNLTHTTVAAGTNAGNGEIAKEQWNESHTLSMATARLLGRTTAAAGAVEEINIGTYLTFAGLELGVGAELSAWGAITPGTGVATFLATPSSANLAAAVTGETGTGALVFGTAPTLEHPTLQSEATPTPVNGMIYLDSTTNKIRARENGAWADMIGFTNRSTGVIEGGVLSIGTPNTTFSISDGRGVILDHTTDPDIPTDIPVSWTGLTNVAVTNIATQLITYICINSAGAIVQSATRPSNADSRSLIFIGVVVHVNNTVVNAVNQEQVVALAPISQLHDLATAIGFFNISGNVFGVGTSGGLYFDKSAGTIFSMGSNWAISTTNPNVLSLSSDADVTFQYRTQTGVNRTGSPSGELVIDPDIYDNAGTFTAVPVNKWTIQRVYVFLSGDVKIQPGQFLYGSYSEAVGAISTGAFVTEPSILANGLLRGFIIVQEGVTTLASNNFIEAEKFGSSTGTGSAAGSTFEDAAFEIYDQTDSTKILKFEASGITTGTTRTLTAPDASGTLLISANIGVTVQAYDADLTNIAALAVTDSNIIVGNGTTWVAESGATARTSLGLGTGDSPQFTSINIGHASDTTLTRVSAGVVAIEGVNILLTGGALGTPSSGTLTNCTADGTNGVGFKNIPQNSQSAAYTLVLGDAGYHIFHPSADTTARTWTIPANASVAYPIGTAITFVNQDAGGVITIAITTDTMRLAGAGTTGSRTLAANGVATAIKVTSTEWIISGTGLT